MVHGGVAGPRLPDRPRRIVRGSTPGATEVEMRATVAWLLSLAAQYGRSLGKSSSLREAREIRRIRFNTPS